MAELKIQEHFQVPEGYFDNLAEQVMKSLPEQAFQPMHVESAKTIKQTNKRRIIPMWTRYAAAACVVGVVIVSALTVFNNTGDKGSGNSAPIAQVATTNVVDTFKHAVETVAPTVTVKETPVLAKADKPVVSKPASVRTETSSATPNVKTPVKKHSVTNRQSYDIDVNSGYDQNEMERAAMYMGIDHQTMCEMMYEEL